jgi:hypothetical protein
VSKYIFICRKIDLIFLFILFLILGSCAKQKAIEGVYKLEGEFNAIELIFYSDLTFVYNSYFDVGGQQSPLEGTYKISNDTITLFLSESILNNDILNEYENINNWKLLLSEDSIFHYQDSNGVFKREYPMMKVK